MAEKIIVTGVNGFVGEHVVNTFKQDGFEVVGVAYDQVANEKVSDALDGYISCNLLDENAVANISLENVRSIIHLAGLSAVGQSFEQPRRYITDNALMTYNLLDHAKSTNLPGRVVVISTGALYDPHQPLPLGESSKTGATSPYAIGKLATEHVVSYFRNRGLDTVAVRPFNHIGPGQGLGFLLPDLYSQLVAAKDGGEMMVGNLDTRRDYTDVRDIVRAYKSLALAGSLGSDVYNICSGRSMSGREILKILQHSTGIENVDITIDPAKIRPSDVMDIYGDSSRIHKELDWTPQIPIEQTIRDFVASQQ